MSLKSTCTTKQYILTSQIIKQRINLYLRVLDPAGRVIGQYDGSAANAQMPTQMKNKIQNIQNLQLFLNDQENLTVNTETVQISVKYLIKLNGKTVGSENLGSLKLYKKQQPVKNSIKTLQEIPKICLPQNQFSMDQLKQILILLSKNLIQTKKSTIQNQTIISQFTEFSSVTTTALKTLNTKIELNQIQTTKVQNMIVANRIIQMLKTQPIDEKKAESLIQSRVKILKTQINSQIIKQCNKVKQELSYSIGKNITQLSMTPNNFNPQFLNKSITNQAPTISNLLAPLLNSNPYRMSRLSTYSLRNKICQNQLFKNSCQFADEGTIKLVVAKKVAILGTQDVRKVSTFGFKIVNSRNRNIGFGIAKQNIKKINKDILSMPSYQSCYITYYQSSTGRVFNGTTCNKKEGNGILNGQLVILEFDADEGNLKVIVSGETRAQFYCSGSTNFANIFVPCIVLTDPGDEVELYQKIG